MVLKILTSFLSLQNTKCGSHKVNKKNRAKKEYWESVAIIYKECQVVDKKVHFLMGILYSVCLAKKPVQLFFPNDYECVRSSVHFIKSTHLHQSNPFNYLLIEVLQELLLTTKIHTPVIHYNISSFYS